MRFTACKHGLRSHMKTCELNELLMVFVAIPTRTAFLSLSFFLRVFSTYLIEIMGVQSDAAAVTVPDADGDIVSSQEAAQAPAATPVVDAPLSSLQKALKKRGAAKPSAKQKGNKCRDFVRIASCCGDCCGCRRGCGFEARGSRDGVVRSLPRTHYRARQSGLQGDPGLSCQHKNPFAG